MQIKINLFKILIIQGLQLTSKLLKKIDIIFKMKMKKL